MCVNRAADTPVATNTVLAHGTTTGLPKVIYDDREGLTSHAFPSSLPCRPDTCILIHAINVGVNNHSSPIRRHGMANHATSHLLSLDRVVFTRSDSSVVSS